MLSKIIRTAASIGLVAALFASSAVLAGTIEFSAYLPPYGVHATVVGDKVKDNNTNGSLVLEPMSNRYNTVAFWVDQKIGTSYVKCSETVTVPEGSDIWLGYYVNAPLYRGHIVRLRSASQGAWGTTVTGTWDYK